MTEEIQKEAAAAGDPPKRRYSTGMVQRRVEIPLGIWNEVLELSKAGGIDVRDALVQLVDAGLQAADEGTIKPRLVEVDHELWDRLDKAKFKNVSREQALAYLVDLGLQSLAGQRSQAPLPPANAIRVRLEELDEYDRVKARLNDAYMHRGALPVAGDVVSWRSSHYEVKQRAFSFPTGGQPIVYLRVQPFGAS